MTMVNKDVVEFLLNTLIPLIISAMKNDDIIYASLKNYMATSPSHIVTMIPLLPSFFMAVVIQRRNQHSHEK